MSATTTTDWTLSSRQSTSLEVYLLGCVDFESALHLQERLIYEISGRGDRLGALLICEHPSVVSLGRDGSRAQLAVSPDDLLLRNIPTYWTNRGGECVMHGPGQLAVYPILPLNRLDLGLADYRNVLERSVIDVATEQRVHAWQTGDHAGVWCRLGRFAQVGVAVKRWVSHHGLFLNVSPDMELQRMVHSTIPESRPTSLAAQRSRPTSMHSVREAMVRALADRLGYEQYHLYTGHPLLNRTRQRVAQHA